MGILLAIFIFVIIVALFSIKVVRQSEVYIIERLGKFYKEAEAGLNLIFPFIPSPLISGFAMSKLGA